MSELQTALIIVGAVVVLALILLSRRDKKSAKRIEPALKASEVSAAPIVPRNGFDEFGVGRVRTRSDVEPKPVPKTTMPEKTEPAPVRTPTFVKSALAPKIVTLYVAEREGTKINGIKIHAALEAQKLSYNETNKAYDRLQEGRVLFSVTSLTAPGYLDRTQATSFSTPGLGLFLRLPGPGQPKAALRDMLATAEALAAALKAVLFDAAHQPLTEDSVRRLAADIEDWTRLSKT
ncbi:MAG: cell division protein ZipA C-terminal FtsZ-binding domain-containing protein [Pseudomonadota bacterium]|mgnify:CR=1 FL=1